MINSRLFFVFVLFKFVGSNEPRCTSKFDYDYKMLQKVVELEEKLNKLDEKLKQQHDLVENMFSNGAGSVFVRWGKTLCPEDDRLLYAGYIAGKKYSDKGSGSNSLCLPSDPSWFNYTEAVDKWRGRIYGTEIEAPDDLFGYSVNNQDMPCAVCKSHRSAVIMIPGRTSCYPALKQEYSGYLMSEYYDRHGPHNYICVDSQPDFLPKGSGNDDQHVLYHVESICGSLPCPPYVQGRELACVVCSI